MKFVVKIKTSTFCETSYKASQKSIQLAIIQDFTVLWEIKFEQMGVIWNFVSKDEDKWKYIINISNRFWLDNDELNKLVFQKVI